jgi:hypothetical protein
MPMPLIKPNDQCYMDTNTVVVTKVYGLGKCYTLKYMGVRI